MFVLFVDAAERLPHASGQASFSARVHLFHGDHVLDSTDIDIASSLTEAMRR